MPEKRPPPPPIYGYKLILFGPRGADYACHITTAPLPPIFLEDAASLLYCVKSIHFNCCHFFWLCSDFSKNDNSFERNEDCTTVFLKWTDFRRSFVKMLRCSHWATRICFENKSVFIHICFFNPLLINLRLKLYTCNFEGVKWVKPASNLCWSKKKFSEYLDQANFNGLQVQGILDLVRVGQYWQKPLYYVT